MHAPVVGKESKKLFTVEEIEKHNTDHHDVWIIVKDWVYDCTEYLELHPDGARWSLDWRDYRLPLTSWRFRQCEQRKVHH
jgi:cytochrome b involved in lipid metabolism